MQGEETSFSGKHLRVEKGQLLYPPVQAPYPPLYFGGSSDVGMQVAGTHIDTYLTWGEPPADVAEKVAAAKAAATSPAAAASRTASACTSSCARRRGRPGPPPTISSNMSTTATIAAAQKTFARYDSVGQQRMARLHAGRRDKLEVSPNLWAGVGLIVRGGAGTALVGSPDEVADRMKEYMALGIDKFILSGYPHLEECYRFAELVFPKLPLKKTTGNDRGPAKNAGPFGEMVANVLPPSRARAAASAS